MTAEHHLSNKDKAYIRANIGKLSDRAMALHIGCDQNAVFYFRKQRDLPGTRPYKKWSKEDIKFLMEHYRKDMYPQEIADKLNRPVGQVYSVYNHIKQKMYYEQINLNFKD